MNEKHYTVSCGWYDYYSPTVVCGPAVENWEAFCATLLPEATERALYARTGSERTWIGHSEIGEHLIAALVDRGYVVCQFEEMKLFGSTIIDRPDATDLLDGDLRDRVIQHNREVAAELDIPIVVDGG